MASITWDNVVAVAPELAATPPPAQTFFLKTVDLLVPESNWGELQELGKTYLAAHLASNAKPGEEGHGPVSAQAAGGLSQSYDVADMVKIAGEYGTTSYGLQYYSFLRMTPAALGLVIGESDFPLGGC